MNVPGAGNKRIRIAALTGAALVCLYAAFGYLVAPFVLRDRIVEAAARAGIDLRVGAVRTDPFFLTVRLVEPRLSAGRANLMLAAPSARARVKWASLWHRTLIVERVSLDEGSLLYSPGGAERRIELGNLAVEATGLELREGRDGRYTASATLGERACFFSCSALMAEISVSPVPPESCFGGTMARPAPSTSITTLVTRPLRTSSTRSCTSPTS